MFLNTRWLFSPSAIQNVECELPPDTVLIAPNAFSCTSQLFQVTLPASILSVGDYAFRNRMSLEEVRIPEGVVEIGSSAFLGCVTLKLFKIPSSVKVVRMNPFNRCASLAAIPVDPGSADFTFLGGVLTNSAGTAVLVYPGGKTGEDPACSRA